jgi:hypothetical protein
MDIKDYALIGFNRLVECSRQAAEGTSQEVQDEIEEYIGYFKDSVIEYAGIFETGDELKDLDEADSVLWADGWCYPNDTFDCIYEFAGNVAQAIGRDEEDIFVKDGE